MSTIDSSSDPDFDYGPNARRNVAVLIAAQAVLGAQIPMIFTIGGLVGGMLAPWACLATLPITMVVFGSMTTAPWLSALMQARGRMTGFMVGALGGFAGGIVAAIGLWTANFWLLLLGSYLSGIYMSAQGFFRFAATDTASDSFRPKAISYVMAGGLLSAILGPNLGTMLADTYVIPFLGTYFAVAAVNVLGVGLFLALRIPKPPVASPDAKSTSRTRLELLSDPRISVAIICAMITYALMNLVMTSTPIAVVGCGFTKQAAGWVVTAHVLAMYAPSFFTGHLISRFGAGRIVWAGLGILAAGGVVALSGVEIANFFVALVFLGIGWNFGFIGATTMLTQSHAPEDRGRVQGMNDTIVFGCVTVASLASGGLMNCSGGDVIAGWNAVNLAMVPLLTLAGAALIWLKLRPQDGEPI